MARRTIGVALVLASASALGGQGISPRVDLILPPVVNAGTGVATTTIRGVLTEGHRLDLLHGGWPTVIRSRLELWRRNRWGTFDRESDYTWDVVVEYLPASKLYHLHRVIDNRVEDIGEVRTVDAAEQLLRRPFAPPLSPARRGDRYFYLLTAEVTSLSMSDIEAWQRWLRGEAQPAVRGRRNPLSALRQGIGSFFSRMLGGDTQTYDSRSSVFSAG